MFAKAEPTQSNLENGSFRNREPAILENRLPSFIEAVHENYWKVQQFSCPLAPALAVICFPTEPNILERSVCEKY